MNLRDYQSAMVDAIYNEWLEHTSTIVVAPTGTGKTILFAAVIERMQPKRSLVIAHREELIWQAREKIRTLTGLESGIEMADLSMAPSLFGEMPVVISTVQTQNAPLGMRKRMSRFNPDDFGLLVIDECHHGTADSYKNLINYYRQNKALKVLGVTATPDRTDEEALGQIFESVAFDYEILDAIHDGWLVPVDQQFVHIEGLDFSEMRTTAGDLNGADLSAVMEAEQNLQEVTGASISIIGNRRAIVFTASVKQAETTCNIFNRHRQGMAEWVCGTTPKDKRHELLAKFQSDQTQVVCNCGVLVEGFDDYGVEVIIMAAPTKSRSRYAQMAGRSTRPLPGIVDGLATADERKAAIASSGKASCLILDFIGNSGRHKLMSSADILGGKVSDAALERAVERAKKLGKPVRMSEALDEAEEQIQELAEQRRKYDELRKARVVAKVSYTTRFVNPFDALDLSPVKERGWDSGRTLSEKQRALLLKQGIDPDSLPYAQARQVIGELFKRWNNGLCSIKQAQVLKRYGYDTKELSRDKASSLLDALAKNRWKKPVEVPAPDSVPF